MILQGGPWVKRNEDISSRHTQGTGGDGAQDGKKKAWINKILSNPQEKKHPLRVHLARIRDRKGTDLYSRRPQTQEEEIDQSKTIGYHWLSIRAGHAQKVKKKAVCEGPIWGRTGRGMR